MKITDPIADLLTRIRNAFSAGHMTVNIPSSKMKMAIYVSPVRMPASF